MWEPAADRLRVSASLNGEAVMAAARDQAARVVRSADAEGEAHEPAKLAEQLRTHVAEEARRQVSETPAQSPEARPAGAPAAAAADAPAPKGGRKKFVLMG